MQTMNHQYYCKWFYNDKTINDVLNNNYVEESGESTDASLVEKIEYKYKKDTYENEYEKEILDVEDDIKYKGCIACRNCRYAVNKEHNCVD